MGRAARANTPRTVTEHAADESLPRMVRFCLAHPKAAIVILVLWFPIKLTVDATRGALEAGKLSACEGWAAFGIFVALARKRDAL